MNMLTPRSRFTATACLLSTATGLFCGTAANLLAETPATNNAQQSEVLQKLESQYRRDGKQMPERFAEQAQKAHRHKKRDLEQDRRAWAEEQRAEEAADAKKVPVSTAVQSSAGKSKSIPVQTVGRSRRRYEENYQQNQQQQPQPAAQAASGTPGATGAPAATGKPATNTANANESYSPPLTKKERKREQRERYRQWLAEQEQLQQKQAVAAKPGDGKTQQQPTAGAAQEQSGEVVPGPQEEAARQPLPQLPLPQLPFQQPAAAPQVTASVPQAAAPVATAQAPQRVATPQTAATVPLLTESETEQEVPAQRARVSTAPQLIEQDRPYNRNRPYTPPTTFEEMNPTPALRNAPPVARRAAVEVPVLNQPALTQPEPRAAEPSPYSGLKLTPDESEQRVARALGGPVEDGVPGLIAPEGTQEAAKAPPVPDYAGSSNSGNGANVPEIPGVRGYCLVHLREHRQYVAGQAQFRSVYHSRAYTFSSADAKADFEKHPERYAPVQDGNDIVSTSSGAAQPGSLDHAAWFKGRLYLFASAENMASFWKSPKNYIKQ